MNKILHYNNGDIDWFGRHRLLSYCGSLNFNPYKDKKEFKVRTTTDKSKVTCKNCLKKLGIKQKPVVDEQKKRFAEHIVDWSELHPDTDEVQEAVKYLEGLEGE